MKLNFLILQLIIFLLKIYLFFYRKKNLRIPQSENNVFRKLAQPVQSIELREIGNYPDFNFDPFYVSNQIGIQTLDLRELSE